MEELLDLNQAVDHMSELHRSKRDLTGSSNETIAQVIQQIQATLEILELKFNEHELHSSNSSGNSFERGEKYSKSGGHRCFVDATTGKVNCSNVIYDDEKTWRTSRNQIDMLIKLLKDKIGKLKEMKKQLRESNKLALAAGRRNDNRRRNDPNLLDGGAGPEFNMSYFTDTNSTPRSNVVGQKEVFRGYGNANVFDSVEQPQSRLIMNSKYYNYSINLNGQKIKHGFDYAKDYYPDLIANDSIAFLRSSKQQNQRKPVLLTMSFPAPHGPEDSAPQYSHLFFNVTTHQ